MAISDFGWTRQRYFRKLEWPNVLWIHWMRLLKVTIVAGNKTEAQRIERYNKVLAAVMVDAEFSSAQVKRACADEKPVFVTRMLNQLEADGYLERTPPKARPRFRWRTDRSQFSPAVWIDSRVYNNRIKRAPESDRPRERLLVLGAPELRTAELLAILVRSGRAGESALQAGEKVAARYSDRLEQLPDAGRGELKGISPVVAETAYCQIMAGIELGRRVVQEAEARRQAKIGGSQDAIVYCQERFARLAEDGAQEEFHIVTLDTKNQTIGTHRISLGALDQTVVHPREVFRPAIKDAAKSIVLVHNHPSGDPTPSEKDRILTGRLEEAGRTVGIQVLDHIIVARNGAVSLREFGL